MSGKHCEMKGRDLRGIFPGDVKTQDMGSHPMVLERQTEAVWPESGAGREKGMHGVPCQAFWSTGEIPTERLRGQTVPSSKPSLNSYKLEEVASPSEVLSSFGGG